MMRYVLTQEQLDRLQQEMQNLKRIHDAKQERLRELEQRKTRGPPKNSREFMDTIAKLETEIKHLRRTNRLKTETAFDKAYAARIEQLEMLLQEERRLREYSEAFARQVELKYAEEVLIKDLTKELVELQKAEINLRAKKIEELERKLVSSRPSLDATEQKELKEVINARSRENRFRRKQIRDVANKLKGELQELSEQARGKAHPSKEEEAQHERVQSWVKEIEKLMGEINDVEALREDLRCMRSEIEYRRKSSVGMRN